MKSPYLPAIVVLVAMSAFALTVLATHDWDPMAFVLDRPEDVPAEQTWGIGYDGQQAYAIAIDPLGAADELDRPAYRYQRILYPMLARGIALGVPDLVPWSMILINLIAACATAYLLSLLLIDRGASPWWSLVPILTFNYLIGVRMDLNEPLAYALALGGLLFYGRRETAWAAVLFALAGLTREVALVFPIALVAWLLLGSRWREALIIGAASFVPYLSWAAVLRLLLGVSPFATPLAKPLWIPFAGMAYLGGIEGPVMVGLWAVIPAGLAAIAAIADLLRRKASRQLPDALLMLSNSAVIAVLPIPTWVDPLAVMRLAAGLVLAIVLWLAQMRPSWLIFVAALWVPSLLLAFMIPGFLL